MPTIAPIVIAAISVIKSRRGSAAASEGGVTAGSGFSKGAVVIPEFSRVCGSSAAQHQKEARYRGARSPSSRAMEGKSGDEESKPSGL
jgi:hypothetical protein